VENPDYHKSNGISALKARTVLRDNFLLLMADHLFEPETARMMVRQRLAPGEVILGVDPDINRIYDIDDATKVRRRGNRIMDIGKELEEYDAIDTGMFLCTPALFEDLDLASRDGDCSLSDGMRRLTRGGWLRALEIDAPWHDLDTPEALAHAGKESLLNAA
jgi:choline kinase